MKIVLVWWICPVIKTVAKKNMFQNTYYVVPSMNGLELE